MSKGLEALKDLFEIANIEQEVMPNSRTGKDFAIIEKELMEKIFQDNYIKMLEDRIDNLETTYLRNKKAIEIIINKEVDIKTFKHSCLKCGYDFYVKYNQNIMFGMTNELLTEEEFNSLKEILS